MSLLDDFMYVSEEKKMTIIQSYSGKECNMYDFFDSKTNRKLGYVNEFFYSPIDNEKLDHTVYELYYDNENITNNHSDDDFTSSTVYDDLEELLEDLDYCL